MLRKLESESGTEIADSGFLIIYEKPADSESRIRIANPAFSNPKFGIRRLFINHQESESAITVQILNF